MYLIDHSRATLHHFGLYQCFVPLLNLPQMFGLIKTGIFDMILQICVVGSYFLSLSLAIWKTCQMDLLAFVIAFIKQEMQFTLTLNEQQIRVM